MNRTIKLRLLARPTVPVSTANMSCRVAMLRMHKDGLIVLPPPTHAKVPVKKIEFTPATDSQSPVVCSVNKLPQLHLQMVTKATSALWNE